MIGELNDEIVGNHFDPIDGSASGLQIGKDRVNILPGYMSKVMLQVSFDQQLYSVDTIVCEGGLT